MKTLRDYENKYSYNSVEDSIQACIAFLSQDEIYDSSVDIIATILKNKIRTKERYIGRVQSNMFCSFDFYYKHYPLDIASMLDTLSRKIILEMPLSTSDDAWLKANISELTQPKLIWKELYKYITEELNLEFKEEN